MAGLWGRNPSSSIIGAFSYASNLVRKANPGSDPRFQRLIARFKKEKISISHGLSGDLSKLEKLNSQVRDIETVVKEKTVEEKSCRFFEEKGHHINKEENSDFEKDRQRLEKLLAKKDETERKIFRSCGLVKIPGRNNDFR